MGRKRRPWLFTCLDGEGAAAEEHLAPPDKRGAGIWQRLPTPVLSLPESGTFALGQQCADQVLKGPSILTSLEHRGEERGLGPREAHVFLEITQPVQTESGTGGSQARPRVLGAGGQGGLPGGNRDGTEGTYGVGVGGRKGRLGCPPPVPHLGLKTILMFSG